VKDFLAILERANDGTWSAYVPDLPGCTSFGPTREEAARNAHWGNGSEPSSIAEKVQVA
jgi:hypothetical protein